MKRIIWILLAGCLVIGFNTPLVLAADEAVSLTVSDVSSVFSTSTFYRASNAIDGQYGTYWLGAKEVDPWWIVFDTGTITHIDDINAIWYSS